MDNNTIINSLKRLERAGSANSRATEKLFVAADSVAARIKEIVPYNVKLPRGYKVINVKSNIGSCDFLVKVDSYGDVDEYIDGIGGYLHGDFNCWIPSQKRTVILNFAKDIAEGWLEEISEFLEKRAAKSEEMAALLEEKAK